MNPQDPYQQPQPQQPAPGYPQAYTNTSPQPATIAPNIAGQAQQPAQHSLQTPPPGYPQVGPAQQQASSQSHNTARHMTGRAGGFPEEESQSHGPGKDKENSNSTQNMLQFAEIRDGLVIMEDGSFRAVVMAQSINFDLMSQEERESIEYAYQSFLNSLYFDIQIQIKSRRVDLRGYIDKLDKLRSQQDNMLLSYLMEDYIEYISYISQESNIMDKQFFIVVPYYSSASAGALADKSKGMLGGLFGSKGGNEKIRISERQLTEAKSELKNRASSIINGLQQMGIQSTTLNTEELAELFYISYNPDTGVRQQITNFQDLTTPAIQQGIGENPYGNNGGVK